MTKLKYQISAKTISVTIVILISATLLKFIHLPNIKDFDVDDHKNNDVQSSLFQAHSNASYENNKSLSELDQNSSVTDHDVMISVRMNDEQEKKNKLIMSNYVLRDGSKTLDIQLTRLSPTTLDEEKSLNDLIEYRFMKSPSKSINQMFNFLLDYRGSVVALDSKSNFRYDHFEDLQSSSTPSKVNGHECERQLSRLVDRLNETLLTRVNDNVDINALLVLDSFGQPEVGLWKGALIWAGDYNACRELQIQDPKSITKDADTRYCWLGLKPTNTPEHRANSLLSIGSCLPDSCDTSNLLSSQRNIDSIMSLIKINSPGLVERFNLHIKDIYCLPQEESPNRSVLKSRDSLILIAVTVTWLMIQIICTLKPKKSSEQEISNSNDNASSSVLSFRDAMSIRYNFDSLFKSHTKGRLSNNDTQSIEPNFACIDGIKVISMSFIMMGHVLLIVATFIREASMTSREHPSFVLSNQMPAFAVNCFFCITGLLTCYQILIENQKASFIHKPSRWFVILILRYLRIMPLYLVVVAYSKYMAKYTNEGPFWDYATSRDSSRYICERESWLTTIFFGANFKNPLDHCVPSAWYLANDFQFFLITPFIINILNAKPKLGQSILKLGSLASFLAGVLCILISAPGHDFTSIAKFHFNSFRTYVTYLPHNYTQPQYRVSAYFIGLLLGHQLYNYVLESKKRSMEKSDKQNNNEVDLELVETKTKPSSHHSNRYWWTSYGPSAALLTLLLVPLIPMIGSRLPMTGLASRIMVSLIMPLYHVVVAFSIGGFILSVATGHTNNLITRILSSDFWKPLARVSLSIVLINIEVTIFIIQGQRQTMYLDHHSMSMLSVYCILSTFAIAIPFAVIFEAPLRTVLRISMDKLMSSLKKAYKSKSG